TSPSPALREREGPSPQGWEGEGLFGFQISQNGLDHSVGIGEDFVVPKTDHFPALALQTSRSLCIGRPVRVLATIEFDHDLVPAAGEVGDVPADRMLSAELE